MTRSRSSALAAPFLFGVVALVFLPMLLTAALAFTSASGVGATAPTGLDNFARLARDNAFWQALGNSAIYVVLAVPLRLAAAAALALVLHRRGAGYAAGRSLAFVPTVVPDVAMALLWLWLLNPIYGPVAHLLHAVGLPAPAWLTDPWAARFGVAIMSAFQVGEGFLVALAWRRTIARSLYDAAAVDGAGPVTVLRRVTLPLMAPVLGLLAVRDLVLSLQLSIGPALLVTRGGPRRATTVLPLYVYDQAFRYFRLGYAAAISLALLAACLAIAAAQYLAARRWA